MNSISRIIIGIGNIGSDYEGTRHYIGFDVVDFLNENGVNSVERKFQHADVTEVTVGEYRVACVKPNTFVNLSGMAAEEALDIYALSVDDMLVVVDDFHLPLGSIRYRGKGSAGGHNGLKSLIESCGSSFARLRFGIGPLPEDQSIVDFVLGRFTSDEQTTYNETVDRASQSVSFYIENGLYNTMNQFNS